MSTRSMTLIEQLYSGERGKFIPLYRHCDGYPTEAGAAIAEALKGNPKTCEEIVKRLLAGDIGEYRLATWMPEQQGDLEHVYVLTREAGEWRITHHALQRHRTALQAPPGSHYSPKREDYRSDAWDKATYTLAEFVELVNADRRAINGRIAARNADKQSRPIDRYPML